MIRDHYCCILKIWKVRVGACKDLACARFLTSFMCGALALCSGPSTPLPTHLQTSEAGRTATPTLQMRKQGFRGQGDRQLRSDRIILGGDQLELGVGPPGWTRRVCRH